MTLTTGSRLGAYEIIAKLGEGGMGEVYRATDTRLDRPVAIKVAHAAFSERFEREARTIAALNHPNIAHLLDVGPNYLVMEFVDGAPIAPGGGVRRVLDLAAQIASGLAAAHAAGIVHRDLKPDNILVAADGRVKILDFGLAKRTQASSSTDATQLVQSSHTTPGTVLGTVAYMSPEQARGLEADVRSDQFAFGLILYELLTGRRAFQKDSAAQTMAAIVEADPDWTALVSVPTALRWIVERCLAKDPRDRYDSTGDLARDLEQLRRRSGEWTGSAVAAQAPVHTRRSSPLAAVAAVVLVALAGAAGWFGSKRLQTPLAEWEVQPIAINRAAANTPAWSPDDRTIAFAQEAGGFYQIFTKRMGTRPEAPVQITRLSQDCLFPFWHPRGDRIYFVSNNELWAVGAAGGQPEKLLSAVRSADISPDGQTLVIARRSTDTSVARPSTGTTVDLWTSGPEGQSPRRRLQVPSFGRQVRFSPDGHRLAVTGSLGDRVLTVTVTDADTWPAAAAVAVSASDTISYVSWMPDSRRLVGATTSGLSKSRLIEVDVDTGVSRLQLESELYQTAPSVSHDGRRVAYSAFALNWDVLSIDLATHAVAPLVDGAGYDGWPAWSADGESVVFTSNRTGDFNLWAHSLRDGSERPLVTYSDFDSPTRLLVQASVSPDSRSVAYQRYAGDRIQLFVSPMGGGVPAELDPALLARKDSPAWSPDSAWVAFTINGGNRELRKTRVGSREPSIMLRGDLDSGSGSPSASQVRWSRTNQILYDSSQGLAVTDDAGRASRVVLSPSPLVADWSADGSLVYAIREGAGRHLELLAIDVASGRVTTVADLGPEPVTPEPLGYANTIRSLAASPDGKRLAFAYLQPDSHIWMLERKGALDRSH